MKRILRWMLTGIVLVAGSANGQTVPIPGKPIRLIVQFPPGGGMDVTGRHLSERLSAALGVPVVIENKPGAGGLIGARELIRATPDGHTLGYFVIDSLSALPHLYAKPPYDPILDFTPIAQVARTGFFLSAHPSVVATNLKELIAFAKENPGKLSYGSWALGSSGHLLLEQLKIQHALDIVHVPYNGIVNAQRDLLVGASISSSTRPLLESGSRRPIRPRSSA